MHGIHTLASTWKGSYMWEIKPVSIIIHLAGGGVGWQTASLLSDRNYMSACVFLHVYICMHVYEWERDNTRERAWQTFHAGRWCLSVGSSTNAGVEFHAEERQTVGQRSHKSNTELVGNASFNIIQCRGPRLVVIQCYYLVVVFMRPLKREENVFFQA